MSDLIDLSGGNGSGGTNSNSGNKPAQVIKNATETKAIQTVLTTKKLPDLVEDPLEHLNKLLINHDFDTVQYTLQACQNTCNRLRDLQQTLALLKYSVMTDEHDDSLRFAKECTENLARHSSKKSSGFVKTLYDQHNEILETIKKRMLEKFDISPNSDSKLDSNTEFKSADRTERISKLIELLSDADKSVFVRDIAKKICSILPKTPSPKYHDFVKKWIQATLTDDLNYKSLVKYDIKKHIVTCWFEIVRDLVAKDDQTTFDKTLFVSYHKLYTDLSQEYLQDKTDNTVQFIDAFNPYCEKVTNNAVAKFTLEFNKVIFTKTHTDMPSGSGSGSSDNNIEEYFPNLTERTEKFLMIIKEFEDKISIFKTKKTIKIIMDFYSSLFEKYSNDIRQFVLSFVRNNQLTDQYVKVLKHTLNLLKSSSKQISNVYVTKSDLIVITSKDPTKSKAIIISRDTIISKEPVETKASSSNKTIDISGFGNTPDNNMFLKFDETVRGISKDIYQKYKSLVIELLAQSLSRFKIDLTINAINNAIKKGKNFLNNVVEKTDKPEAKVVETVLAMDISDQAVIVAKLINDIGEFDDNIKTYLITDVTVFYKKVVDIQNLSSLKKSAFEQIIMDLYQIRIDTKTQTAIFAEIEGRVKFLTGDILNSERFIEQFNYFYPHSTQDSFSTLVKYIGGPPDKIQELNKLFSKKHNRTN